jgi:hypothetical protein
VDSNDDNDLVRDSVDHKLSLLVTRIDDLTLLEPNRDGITGYEDVETIVSGVDLSNDERWVWVA